MTDITGGHGLEDYYCAHISSLHKLPTRDRIAVVSKNLLQPTQSGKPYALVTKNLSGEFSCALVLAGSFLQIQMAAELNDFQGLPFTAASTAIISTVSVF